jgi:hypothetical protein
MIRPLPYPGHSWSFSQHAVGLKAKTIYDFLKCAAPFEGQITGYDTKITELMIATGVLTANERDGIPDAWRDYQQLLAELGLIYSTKICRALTITELGHMFLAGEIGFSELIGAQALRYQYPNGQKSVIQERLRQEIGSHLIPETLTEFQVQNGILIKPGTLILRILIQLHLDSQSNSLSVSECQAFLVPCRKNAEWTTSYSEILAHRASSNAIDSINRHARRNIQDWFKFLTKSDFFEGNTSQLRLSAYAISNINTVNAYCQLQEDASTFWIPTGYDKTSRIQWFDWFGHLSFDTQKALRLDVADNLDYLQKNYVSGVEDDDEDELVAFDASLVNLQPIDLAYLGRETAFTFTDDIEALADRLKQGAQKRHAKTLLHDRIIRDLAETFISQGAKVESDPNSVDLFAAWPSGHAAIFEVKTVTRRSLQNRLRTAVGQIEEYAYRRIISGFEIVDKVVVINTELTSSSWQTSFLTEHMGIGLICKSARSYDAFAPASSMTKEYWTA